MNEETKDKWATAVVGIIGGLVTVVVGGFITFWFLYGCSQAFNGKGFGR